MHVYLPLERELCPFDLAPVTSTAIQMLFGDTVAIALMQAKNLTREQYALNHPAGRIGKRLIFRVSLSVMLIYLRLLGSQFALPDDKKMLYL
jgi:arabinose-5-phosphate isomerase